MTINPVFKKTLIFGNTLFLLRVRYSSICFADPILSSLSVTTTVSKPNAEYFCYAHFNHSVNYSFFIRNMSAMQSKTDDRYVI